MQQTASHTVGRWGVSVFLVAVAIAISQGSPAAAQSAEDGKDIFEAKCTACHTIGGGSLVGPDLEGVTTRREPDWLARWIAAPDVMLAEDDPIAAKLLVQFDSVAMPNLGLTDAEVASVIAYLDAGADQGAEPVPIAEPVQPGDPSTGKALFEGSIRFENGGPPCLACHSIAGIGALGGGALGPDLTGAWAKFGEEGIGSILATTPFATMRPIFGDRPLTEQEQAHLAAFLEQAAVSERTAASVGQLALLAAAGAAFLLVLMRFIWRRRLTGVRRPMVARSRARVHRSEIAKRELQKTTPRGEGR